MFTHARRLLWAVLLVLTPCLLMIGTAKTNTAFAFDASDCTGAAHLTVSTYSNTCVTNGNIVQNNGFIQLGIPAPTGASPNSIKSVTYQREVNDPAQPPFSGSYNNSGTLVWNSKYNGFLQESNYGLHVDQGGGLSCQPAVQQNTFTITVTKADGTQASGNIDLCNAWNIGTSHSGPALVSAKDPTGIISSLTKSGQAVTTGTATGQWHTKRNDGTIHPIAPQGVISLTLSGPKQINFQKTDALNGTIDHVNNVTLTSGTMTFSDLPPGDYTLTFTYDDSFSTPTSAGEDHVSIHTIGPKTFTVVANKVTHITNGDEEISDPPPGSTCTTTDSQGNAQDCGDYIDCGDNSGLGWITCSIISWAQHGATLLDKFITDSLDIDVEKVFDVGACNGNTTNCGAAGYYKAWSSFRIIATAIIIIAGLIMVVSQALGFEFLDAYTIRKVLPRLAIAIIGISLSWPLMKFVVGFFDTVGFDIRELIYAPFSGMQSHIVLNLGLVGVFGLAAGALVMGAASLTFILTGLLAMLVGFVVLVIRQILLIVLIVAAPIAIACYILPGTQKVWKLWSDNFLGLLMMFPIISAFIAIGHVFSQLALSGNTITSTPGTATVSQVIGVIAYFIPYFLLPITFRLASGFIGNIAGFVNDRNRGVFDRLKKARGNASAKNIHAMKTGSRFSERNALTRGFNRTSAGVGTGWKGRFGIGTRGRQATEQARRTAALADVMKSPEWSAIQHDDNALHALTYNNAAAARAGLVARGISAEEADRAVGAAQASVGFGRSQAIAAAQQLSTTGTGYESIEDVARTIARASGGDSSTISSLAGFINSDTKRAMRHDLAPGFGALNDLSRRAAGLPSSNAGKDAAGRPVPMSLEKANENAWNSGSLYQIANGKTAALKNMTTYWTEQYQQGLSTGNVDQITKARKAYYELREMKTQASGENATVINNTVAQFDSLADRFGTTATGEYTVEADKNHTMADTAARAQARTMRQDPAFAARMDAQAQAAQQLPPQQ